MKDILFKCNSNTKKIVTESNYDFSNLFMVKKYDEKYNIFWKCFDKINNISYKNEIIKLAKRFMSQIRKMFYYWTIIILKSSNLSK